MPTVERIFEHQALQRQIHDALASAEVDATHRNAVVLVGTIDQGVGHISGAYVHRLDETWQIAAVFGIQSGERPRAGVEIKATW